MISTNATRRFLVRFPVCPGPCYVLLVSVCIFSSFFGFLPQSKDMEIRVSLIGDSKFIIGVNVSISLIVSWNCTFKGLVV